MQKYEGYAHVQQRMPMRDLTNFQQKTFNNIKYPVQSVKADSCSFAFNSRTIENFCSFDSSKCLHLHKLEAIHSRHFNCIDCGAFVSFVYCKIIYLNRKELKEKEKNPVKASL